MSYILIFDRDDPGLPFCLLDDNGPAHRMIVEWEGTLNTDEFEREPMLKDKNEVAIDLPDACGAVLVMWAQHTNCPTGRARIDRWNTLVRKALEAHGITLPDASGDLK